MQFLIFLMLMKQSCNAKRLSLNKKIVCGDTTLSSQFSVLILIKVLYIAGMCHKVCIEGFRLLLKKMYNFNNYLNNFQM